MRDPDNPRFVIPKDRWGYETYFREYLLLLAKNGSTGLESGRKYPEKIELSQGWHRTFNIIRNNSLEGSEYWGYIGFKSDRRSLWFPATPARGYEGCVPGELIKEEIQKAKQNFGIVDLLGDIHSHPRNFWERFEQRLPTMNKNRLKANFSVGDLYIIANTEYFRPLMGLVEGEYNLLAFRTREATGLKVHSSLFTQEQFQTYWYENNGFKFLGKDKETGAEMAMPVSLSANYERIVEGIVKRHSLVLYQGKVNADLERVKF